MCLGSKGHQEAPHISFNFVHSVCAGGVGLGAMRAPIMLLFLRFTAFSVTKGDFSSSSTEDSHSRMHTHIETAHEHILYTFTDTHKPQAQQHSCTDTNVSH